MVKNLREFVLMCDLIVKAGEPEKCFDLFEDHCTQDVRDQVYSLVDFDSTPEPFRAAMEKIGFVI